MNFFVGALLLTLGVLVMVAARHVQDDIVGFVCGLVGGALGVRGFLFVVWR